MSNGKKSEKHANRRYKILQSPQYGGLIRQISASPAPGPEKLQKLQRRYGSEARGRRREIRWYKKEYQCLKGRKKGVETKEKRSQQRKKYKRKRKEIKLPETMPLARTTPPITTASFTLILLPLNAPQAFDYWEPKYPSMSNTFESVYNASPESFLSPKIVTL